MLLCALASCFTTTFRAIAGYAGFEYTDLEAEAEGVVSKADSGYSFSEIVLRPSLTIVCEKDQLHSAFVSRALATAQKFEAQVKVSDRSPVG